MTSAVRRMWSRLLFRVTGILLVFESAYSLRIAYALLRIHRLYFPASPYSSQIPAQALWGAVLLGLAVLFLVRPNALSQTTAVLWPAAALYGIWLEHQWGPHMSSVAEALNGDDFALGFLAGIGFVAVGFLAFAAWALTRNELR